MPSSQRILTRSCPWLHMKPASSSYRCLRSPSAAECLLDVYLVHSLGHMIAVIKAAGAGSGSTVLRQLAQVSPGGGRGNAAEMLG